MRSVKESAPAAPEQAVWTGAVSVHSCIHAKLAHTGVHCIGNCKHQLHGNPSQSKAYCLLDMVGEASPQQASVQIPQS